MRRRGFTLCELMIVIGIIAVLISLLLPAVQSAREAARRASCSNNLLQLGIALSSYVSTHTVLPPGAVSDQAPITNLPQGYNHGWMVQILPYLGQNNLYRCVDQDASVYDAENQTVRTARIGTLLCPSNPQSSGLHYAGCHHDVEAPIAVDNRGVLYLNSRVKYDDITDGLATTILLGEISMEPPTLGWMSGSRATLRNTGQPLSEPDLLFPAVRGRGAAFQADESEFAAAAALVQDGSLPVDYVGGYSSRHQAGANFLFCNGSVRYVKNSVDVRIYRLLGNRADGEWVSDDSY